MGFGAAELEAFYQASLRQKLTGAADNFGQAYIARKYADDVGAACDPDDGLVLFGLQFPLGVNLEKLRMQKVSGTN